MNTQLRKVFKAVVRWGAAGIWLVFVTLGSIMLVLGAWHGTRLAFGTSAFEVAAFQIVFSIVWAILAFWSGFRRQLEEPEP